MLITLAESFDTAMPENTCSFMQASESLYCLSQLPLVFYCMTRRSVQFSSVQLLSCVRLFATPWTAARQACLSITNSQSSLRLTSIESVMPSSHLILCHPFLLPPSIFPSSGSFPMSQFFASGGQTIGISTSISVLSVNIQD